MDIEKEILILFFGVTLALCIGLVTTPNAESLDEIGQGVIYSLK